MIENRSVPSDTILPHIVYQNVDEAIAWLSRTFGFSEHYRYGNPTSGAQMHLGNAWIMLRKAEEGSASPAKFGYGTQSLTVFVDDLEGHFAKTKAEGAKIVEDLHETEYGEFQYGAKDLDGHHWLFSRHAHDRRPEEWGATVANAATMPTQISPMLAVNDGNAAIEFYKAAFGAILLWHLDAGGHVVAGLLVNGGKFFLAQESPPHGTRSPASVGFTTVRIELFVDDPVAVHRQTVAAGATERSPVTEHTYSTIGTRPIKRMLQGSLIDPFGHMWLVGKIIE